jgi:hypothetical protein
MSGVTEREYLESRIAAVEAAIARDIIAVRELSAAHDVAHEREHQSVQLAISKAEDSLTVRLEAMNAFRQQLDRERGSYVTRLQLDDRLTALNKEAEEAAKRITVLEAQMARLSGWFAAASVALTVSMFVLNRLWH